MITVDLVPSATPDEMSDLLIDVAQTRSRTSFTRLFEHFGPRIKSYLRHLGADENAAEELMQEVMVWRRASQFDRNKARASTWIFTIARNKRIAAIRRERRPELDPNDPALVPDSAEDPHDAASARNWSDLVHQAIGELAAEQKEILRLHYFEEKSHAEISNELELPLGTVKSRIRLSVKRPRSQFQDLR